MSKTVFLVAAVLFFLLAGNVRADNICDLTKLPPHPSVNSSMLFIIPTTEVNNNVTKLYTLSDPIRLHWDLREMSLKYLGTGTMDKFGDCWICEFSGKGAGFNGECGPTPFKTSGNFLMDFFANDFDTSLEFNRSNFLIHSETTDSGINIDSEGLHITVDTPPNLLELPTMTIYDAEDGEMLDLFDEVNLTARPSPGRYFIDIESLEAGTYYISVDFTTAAGQSGGELFKIVITEEDVQLTAETDKESYLIGETVEITGQTRYPQVTATVRSPSGTIGTLGTVDASDGEYAHLFHITGEDEGDYEVTVNSGSDSLKVTFGVDGKVIDVDPLSLTFVAYDLTTELNKYISINNTGGSTATLSIITEGILGKAETTLGDSALSAGSGTTLTVTVDPSTLTDARTSGTIHIKTGDVTIPVEVIIDLDLPPATSGGENLRITPAFWDVEDCMVGEDVTKSFTVVNTGDPEISGFDYTYNSDSGEIEVSDTTTFPDSVGDASRTANLVITPGTMTASGNVEVDSSGGSAKIYITTDCVSQGIHDDVSDLESDIETLILDFDDANYDSTTIDDLFLGVIEDLGVVKTSLESGDYSYAKETYASARARLETLQDVYFTTGTLPPEEAPDFMLWIYVIIVVVIVALVGFLVFTKFRGKLFKGGGEGEGAVEDEELY